MKVGIFGLGSVGRDVAKALVGGIDGLTLAAAAAKNEARASDYLRSLGVDVPVVDAARMAAMCDIVLECAPAAVFEEVARAAVGQGRVFMPLSVGGLLRFPDLVQAAQVSGGRIVVPTGALLGLDAVRAAAEGKIDTVRVVTRKPPKGLMGAPYLAEHGIELEGLTEPLQIFKGFARAGVAGFPANVNVVAALSLAGIGPDRTELEIWADPTVTRNTHRIELESDSARMTMSIENVPSENAATGRITALSAIACLRGLISPLKVGS
ncbi:MAG: aspartate dehydrogenase [Burkholderiaceae bacterium]